MRKLAWSVAAVVAVLMALWILPNVVQIDSDGVSEMGDDAILPIAEAAVENVR